jgi:hypothetical protein
MSRPIRLFKVVFSDDNDELIEADMVMFHAGFVLFDIETELVKAFRDDNVLAIERLNNEDDE